MHRPIRSWRRTAWCLLLAGTSLAARAQPPHNLAQAFEQAWAQHPSAQALSARRTALDASRQAAQAWTAQPGALELRAKTDRPGSDRGAQELEFGVSLPLWLPGQRARSQALADQESQALDAHQAGAQLQLAGELREAWWAWQRARAELALSATQVALAQALAGDVHRRVRAGDLSRADAHQAEGALALAQANLARAEATTLLTQQALQGLLGPPGMPAEQTDVQAHATLASEPPPDTEAETGEPDLSRHPLVRDQAQQAAVASQAAELARTQARANPELLLGTVHSRDQRGEPRQRQLTIGVRWPWGESPGLQAQAARAQADATELAAQASIQRQRVLAAIQGARARHQAALRLQAAAQRRATLALESLGFFDQSFRLGETDLPTRLRVAQEAQDASRQAALAAIDVAAATSAWRQAAGLLPQ